MFAKAKAKICTVMKILLSTFANFIHQYEQGLQLMIIFYYFIID